MDDTVLRVTLYFLLIQASYYHAGSTRSWLVAQLWELMGIVRGRYRFLSDLQALDSCRPPAYESALSSQPLPLVRGPSPLNLFALYPYLSSHPDQEFSAYIYNGLQHGFRIGFDRNLVYLRTSTRNHHSSTERPGIITDYFQS